MTYSNNIFVISAMKDYNVSDDKVMECIRLKNLLNDHLKISDYSEKVTEICMTFMAINPTSKAWLPDRKRWHWKSGVFEIFMNVPDYEAFCNATTEEARGTIANLFVKAIERYLCKRTDINHQQLLQDVTALFQKHRIV